MGGKLTTLRRMGEQAVDAAVESLRASGFEAAIAPCSTGERLLPGGEALAIPDGRFPADVAEHLAFAYGSRANRISALIDERRELGSRIDPDLPYLWAEVVLAVRDEHAREVADVFCRRVPLFRDGRDQGLGAAEQAADLIGRELGWDTPRRTRSLAAYRSMVESLGRWRNEALIR